MSVWKKAHRKHLCGVSFTETNLEGWIYLLSVTMKVSWLDFFTASWAIWWQSLWWCCGRHAHHCLCWAEMYPDVELNSCQSGLKKTFSAVLSFFYLVGKCCPVVTELPCHYLKAPCGFLFLSQPNHGRSRCLFPLKESWLVAQYSDRMKTIQIGAFQDGPVRLKAWNLG